MRGARRLARAFRPLDTSTVDAALDRFEASSREKHVQARVLRTNINCADAGAICDAVKKMTGGMVSLVGPGLRELFRGTVHQQVPTDMVEQLRKLD